MSERTRVDRDGSMLRATLRNVHTRSESSRAFDAVVVEHGIVPNDNLYFDLRDPSSNGGAIDIAALTNGRAQPVPDDGVVLYRIGDAVASRGIATSIYEARRLCQLL